MPVLTDKIILILSPQSWGRMFISKHHYALELARRGNKVYFLDPPEQAASDLRSGIECRPSEVHENLFLIRHRLWFPYNLKFHAQPLFHAGMRLHMRKVLSVIGKPVDIIWSFDLGNLYPLRFFGSGTYKIFHPVDEPLNAAAITSGKGADIIFSVTREILEKYHSSPAPKYFINHGVSSSFLLPVDMGRAAGNPVRVGLSGNLIRPDLDRETLLRIIKENRDVIFECWGSYSFSFSNIGGNDDQATKDFITALTGLSNVVLHGAIPADDLAAEIHRMDAFLICYDIEKDQSKGTNYHKIIEYLSTGKTVVSNNVTTYKDLPGLIQMTQERAHNRELPALFRQVIASLQEYNGAAAQEQRVAFAKENTYSIQLERIGRYINKA